MTTHRDPSTATYVFCLVHASRRPSLRGVPASLPGAGTPRLLAVDRDIWAVVADAPLDRFGGEALQHELQDVETISRHAIAHASVIEFFFRRAPVIPLKLFTLFSSDDRAIAHLKKRRASLRALFAELRGLEEWGVRVIASDSRPSEAATLTSGRDYLTVKKFLKDQSGAPSHATVKQANGALKSLGALASKVRKDVFPPPARGRPYVTGASFLVSAARRRQWERAVAKLSTGMAAHGHRVELSGPWPPYRFVSK
jgi:hypothetical protein